MILPLLLLVPTGDLDALKDARAAALVERAEAALEARLYLDAERCALEARGWDADVEGVDALVQAIQDGRREHAQGDAKTEYRAYLESKAYAQAREGHAEALEELREDHAERALELAEDAADPALALTVALDLGADERAAKRAVGKQVYVAALEAWQASRGLAQLELGERLQGDPLDDDALDGKVVVWRSFSL